MAAERLTTRLGYRRLSPKQVADRINQDMKTIARLRAEISASETIPIAREKEMLFLLKHLSGWVENMDGELARLGELVEVAVDDLNEYAVIKKRLNARCRNERAMG